MLLPMNHERQKNTRLPTKAIAQFIEFIP